MHAPSHRVRSTGACPPLRPLAALIALLACSLAQAQHTLAPVVVTGQSGSQAGPVEPAADSPSTLHEISAEGVELFGGKGGANPYTVVSELPGAQVQTLDAYGLVNQQGGNKGLRVRGEIVAHGANGTVDGVPLNGPGAGPGYLFLIDAENVAGVSFAQGPIPPDRFSTYNTAGQIDTRLLWPREKPGGSVSLGWGQDDFKRIQGRFDSGRLASDTAVFVSASTTSADKWRGVGESPKRRDNFALGLSQKIGAFDARLLYAHNEMTADNYKGLTYEQSKDESLFDKIDYDPVPTGKGAAQWVNWQGYNRQYFETSAWLGELSYRFNDRTTLSVKPFYGKEEGYYYYASGANVRKWDIDHATYGVVSELDTRLGDTLLKVGYGWVSMEPPGPPTQWKHYTPDLKGGLTFNGWNLLADVTDRHDFHNLFASAEHRFGALQLKGGVRFVRDSMPSIDYYDPAGVGDLPFEEALAQSKGKVAARSVKGGDIDEWAPYLGVVYTLSPAVDLRAAYGRNLGTPAFDAFQSAPIQGLPKQALWDGSEMEKADTIDLAARIRFERGYLEPVLYYTRYRNKGVSLYDPDYKATYNQNIAKAHQLGLTLSGGWLAASNVQLFGSLSWMRSVFDDDLRTAASTVLDTDGRQLPDVPSVMASLGARWDIGPVSVSPVIHHMGKRYANVEHTQTLSAYTVANLDVSYRTRTPFGGMKATLAVINLFDEKYIGYNNANETSNGSSFYPGAPRTVMGKLTFDF